MLSRKFVILVATSILDIVPRVWSHHWGVHSVGCAHQLLEYPRMGWWCSERGPSLGGTVCRGWKDCQIGSMARPQCEGLWYCIHPNMEAQKEKGEVETEPNGLKWGCWLCVPVLLWHMFSFHYCFLWSSKAPECLVCDYVIEILWCWG